MLRLKIILLGKNKFRSVNDAPPCPATSYPKIGVFVQTLISTLSFLDPALRSFLEAFAREKIESR
jgi:hypothetical protein